MGVKFELDFGYLPFCNFIHMLLTTSVLYYIVQVYVAV